MVMSMREMLFYDKVFIEGTYLRYWESYGTAGVYKQKPVWLLTENKSAVMSVTIIPDDLGDFRTYWLSSPPEVKIPTFDRILDAKAIDYLLVPEDGRLVVKKRRLKKAPCVAAALDGSAYCDVFARPKVAIKFASKYGAYKYFGPFENSTLGCKIYYVDIPDPYFENMSITNFALLCENGKKYVYRLYVLDNGVFLRVYRSDTDTVREYPLLLQTMLMQPVYDHYLRGFMMLDEYSKMVYDLFAGKVWSYDEEEKKFVLMDEFVGAGQYFDV